MACPSADTALDTAPSAPWWLAISQVPEEPDTALQSPLLPQGGKEATCLTCSWRAAEPVGKIEGDTSRHLALSLNTSFRCCLAA